MNSQNTEFYGAVPQTKIESELQQKLEELAYLGYTVLENVISKEELDVLRKKLDTAYQVQQEEVFNEFTLESIQEENQVRGPLCYDDHFIDIAKNEKVIEVIKNVLGNYFLIHLQIGII